MYCNKRFLTGIIMLVFKRLLLFCSFFVLFSFLFCCYKKRGSVKSKRWCQDNVQRNLWFTASSVFSFLFILKLATLSPSFLGSFQSGSLSVGWFVSFQRQVCSIFLMILWFFFFFFFFSFYLSFKVMVVSFTFQLFLF